MATVPLQITRRRLLQTALAGGAAAVVPSTPLAAAEARSAATPWYLKGKIQKTYNICDMCPWRCGIIVSTVDGVVRKIDGNPKDPKSNGMLCGRGQGGVSFMYDPDRLRAPMLRTGERGEGKFKEVTWEEALDVTASKLNSIAAEYGPESVAVFGHTSGDFWLTDFWAQAWGTPNASKPASTICLAPRDEAAILMTGSSVGGHEPVDWDAIECITLIGCHIGEDTRNTLMQDFANARARGAKVIVVDPRYSTVASKADIWLPIKPGTDTALLLAWTNVIIGEELYDKGYVAEWTTGFDLLKEHVVDFTPEWAAEITELPADKIRESARMMAEVKPRSVIVPGRHVAWYGNDTQRLRAEYNINALLGAYGRVGGMYFNKSPYLPEYPHAPFQVIGSSGGCSAAPGEESAELPLGPSGKARADGVRGVKFLRGSTAIQELIDPMISGEPYPIKALIVYGMNLLQSIPNQPRTIEALKKLDLVVVVDVLPTEHVAWADVVMPEATSLERWDELSIQAFKTPYVHLREPAVEPYADTKPGWWIARELGMRTGLERYFPWETAEEWVTTKLQAIGSSPDKLRAEGGIVIQEGKPYLEDFGDTSPFTTASGKFEFYSEALKAADLDPLPVYEPTEDPPDGFFRLLYGRDPLHTFAKTQNTPVLSEIAPENELWINADKVKSLGFSDGDRVMLENQDGATSGPIKIKATQRIRPDAVFMSHGFGRTAKGLSRAYGKGASDVVLQTRYALDPICGGAGLRVNFVKLVKES